MKQKCNIKMGTENKKALGEIKTMAKKFYKSVEGWEDKVKDRKKNKNPNSCTLEEKKKRFKKIMQLTQEIQCPNRRNNGKLIVNLERKNWKEEKKEKLLKNYRKFSQN